MRANDFKSHCHNGVQNVIPLFRHIYVNQTIVNSGLNCNSQGNQTSESFISTHKIRRAFRVNHFPSHMTAVCKVKDPLNKIIHFCMKYFWLGTALVSEDFIAISYYAYTVSKIKTHLKAEIGHMYTCLITEIIYFYIKLFLGSFK